MNNKAVIGIALTILALIGILFAMQRAPSLNSDPNNPNPNATPPPAPLIPEDKLQQVWPGLIQNAASPTPLGNPKAGFTVVEIGDFQCPNCGKAEPMVMSSIQGSNGKAKLYFYNFPIPQIHPHALIAAQAGMAAAAQGKFWEMYKMMYNDQDELIDSQIEFNARNIPNLNTQKFTSDLESGKYLSIVSQQADFAQHACGIDSVPTVLVKNPKGQISVYQGADPTMPHPTYPGIVWLTRNPPWGPNYGKVQAPN